MADRLANCIALCCVVAWRVSWLTMLRRLTGGGLHRHRTRLLDRSMPPSRKNEPRDLAFYMTAIACLGGYLDRAGDGAPGTTFKWRGFSRLADLVIEFQTANLSSTQFMGKWQGSLPLTFNRR